MQFKRTNPNTKANTRLYPSPCRSVTCRSAADLAETFPQTRRISAEVDVDSQNPSKRVESEESMFSIAHSNFAPAFQLKIHAALRSTKTFLISFRSVQLIVLDSVICL
ncbi:hypothetical protein Salat_1281800 [Sesamum alatum]|uniref:Uncharacterized protein n=1 Tax=Sesamum alatum TaxID=300844 RepID=A0AAE1YH71_9LAMI|nr:hypothetical protein Salat_1281800 [Sesamum alatum]